MERITSRQNPIVRRFRELIDSPGEHLLLDGVHLLEEALASGLSIEVVAIADAVANGPAGALARRAGAAGARMLNVSDGVLAALSPVRQPSGVAAIARRRAVAMSDALQQPPQLVLML